MGFPVLLRGTRRHFADAASALNTVLCRAGLRGRQANLCRHIQTYDTASDRRPIRRPAALRHKGIIYIKGSFIPDCFFKQTIDRLFFLRSLSAVFGTCLASVVYACSIKGASDDMVSYTRQILNSSASDQNNAVLLQIVADARDISRNFDTVSQTYSGNLSKSGIRLLRCYCLYRSTYASLLW